MLPLDVSASQQRLHDALVRTMSPTQKFEVIDDLSGAVRKLALVGLRQRNPGGSDALVRWLLVEQLYGHASALRWLGDRPAR